MIGSAGRYIPVYVRARDHEFQVNAYYVTVDMTAHQWFYLPPANKVFFDFTFVDQIIINGDEEDTCRLLNLQPMRPTWDSDHAVAENAVLSLWTSLHHRWPQWGRMKLRITAWLISCLRLMTSLPERASRACNYICADPAEHLIIRYALLTREQARIAHYSPCHPHGGTSGGTSCSEPELLAASAWHLFLLLCTNKDQVSEANQQNQFLRKPHDSDVYKSWPCVVIQRDAV